MLLRILLALLTCVCLSPASMAGLIVFTNNETLKGDLESINDKFVIWTSPVLGKIKIPKKSVKQIETERAFKVRGSKRPCLWRYLEDDNVTFSCREGSLTTVPFYSMSELARFEGYAKSLRDYRGKATLLGSKQTGNKQRQDWVADTSIQLRYSDFRHDFRTLYERRSSNGKKADVEAEFEYSIDWFFRPSWFWFSDLNFLKEERRDIALRSAIATGVGFQFWERKRSALSLGLGVDFSDERYNSGVVRDDPDNDSDTAWRLSMNYRFLFPMDLEFVHRNQLLYSAVHNDAWQLESETRLVMPIAKGLSANMRFDYDYDNDPVDNNEKEDTTLRFGVGYKW